MSHLIVIGLDLEWRDELCSKYSRVQGIQLHPEIRCRNSILNLFWKYFRESMRFDTPTILKGSFDCMKPKLASLGHAMA